MELNILQRVVLINQYRILAKLEPDQAKYYEELIEILEHGFSIFYSEIDNMVYEEIPPEEGSFVLDILYVYRIIDDYIRDNPKHPFKEHHWIYFHGFDGNNEFNYLNFARFIINKQGKFTEQIDYFHKNDGLNSHTVHKNKYQAMINKYKEIGKDYDLSEGEIRQILDAEPINT